MSIYSFNGMEVAMVMNGVIDLDAPVDPNFFGFSIDQLHDESIMTQYDYIANGRRWYAVVNSSTPLTPYQSYNNDGVYTFDAAAKMVRVVYTIRDWTPEEIRAFQLSHPRVISLRALRFRFTDEERAALDLAMQDKPDATAQERHDAALARALNDSVFSERYGAYNVNMNLPGFQSAVQKMEEVGLIAAGRANEIIWTDPSSNDAY